MQVHQIVIRPQGNLIVLLYVDSVGRRETLVLDSSGISGVSQVISECQSRLPTDANHPAKAEIQQEISELEQRVTQLKQSIGVT